MKKRRLLCTLLLLPLLVSCGALPNETTAGSVSEQTKGPTQTVRPTVTLPPAGADKNESGGEEVPPTTTAPPKTEAPPKPLPPPVTPPEEEPKEEEMPKDNPRKEILICLDAGHGLKDPGAIGVLSGVTYYEKNFNLSVALLLRKNLAELGYSVLMIREADTSLLGGSNYNSSYQTTDEALARRQLAKKKGAHLYLSIHCNAYAGEGRAYGPIVFYNGRSDTTYRAKSLAEVFSGEMSGLRAAFPATGAPRIREGNSYIVLKDTALPALLIELGFMTDHSDLTLLSRKDWQEACARRLSSAVEKSYMEGLIG